MKRPPLVKFLESQLYESRTHASLPAIAMVQMKAMLEDSDFLDKHCLYPSKLLDVLDTHHWLTLRFNQHKDAAATYGALTYCGAPYALTRDPVQVAVTPLPNKKSRVAWRAEAISPAGYPVVMSWETDHEEYAVPDCLASPVNLGVSKIAD